MKVHYSLPFLLVFFFFSHCADLMKIAQKGGIEEPHVRISNTKLSGLSFEQADLIFDIEINNPNPIGISLSGFDYDFLLNNTSFLKGEQNNTQEIRANDLATIQLPLSLVYDNIFKTYQRLKNEDNITYTLNTGLSFNLPVLGKIRIPVSASGDIPSIKIPAISIKYLKLNRLTLTGADFNLAIGIHNPNNFGFNINTVNYKLLINQSNWANGQTSQKTNLAGKDDNILLIPFTLNFLQIGSSLYQDISRGTKLNYQFSGSTNLSSSLDVLGQIDLPFNVSGQIDVLK